MPLPQKSGARLWRQVKTTMPLPQKSGARLWRQVKTTMPLPQESGARRSANITNLSFFSVPAEPAADVEQ
jgi:hypothetical protein